MKYLVLFFSLFVLSVSAQDQGPPPPPKEPKVNCAVKISFGSSGGGIDGNKYDEIKKMIESNKLKYTEKKMGREGETEICLPMTELKKSKKKNFISRLKKTASSGQLVSVTES